MEITTLDIQCMRACGSNRNTSRHGTPTTNMQGVNSGSAHLDTLNHSVSLDALIHHHSHFEIGETLSQAHLDTINQSFSMDSIIHHHHHSHVEIVETLIQ